MVMLCDIDCLNQIKKLRDNGYLPNESIELLQNIINLDFDKLLTKVESETGLIIPGNKKDYYTKASFKNGQLNAWLGFQLCENYKSQLFISRRRS